MSSQEAGAVSPTTNNRHGQLCGQQTRALRRREEGGADISTTPAVRLGLIAHPPPVNIDASTPSGCPMRKKGTGCVGWCPPPKVLVCASLSLSFSLPPSLILTYPSSSLILPILPISLSIGQFARFARSRPSSTTRFYSPGGTVTLFLSKEKKRASPAHHPPESFIVDNHAWSRIELETQPWSIRQPP